MEALSPFVLPLLLLVGFYFLIIRPARTRQRAALELQNRLAPGLEVMTTSGLYGRVTAVEDELVRLELSPGVTVRVAKPAVGRIITEEPGPATEPDAQDVTNGSDDR